ncbi:Anaerobic nitric oxide reductase transcription regulator NorR [compost metagenome]
MLPASPSTEPDSASLPRIWAIGMARISRSFAQILPRFAGRGEFKLIEAGFEAAANAINQAARQGQVDAVVAAGLNGAYLRRHVSVPVVQVKIIGFEVMNALSTARRISPRVALLGQVGQYPELDTFLSTFSLDIPVRTYQDPDDALAQVQALKGEGIEVIVGSGLLVDYAERIGLTGVLVYSPATIGACIEDAIEITRLQRIESGRREYLNAVLSNLDEGVAAVDASGRVQALNPAVERLLGISASGMAGRRLEEISPALSLDEVLRSGKREAESIHRLAGKMVVVNRIPLATGAGLSGAVLTLQEAGAIHRADRNLRTRARMRAHAVRYTLDDLFGTAPPVEKVRMLGRRYARVDSTVLIGGESGTGKEVLAQGIHQASARHSFPFIAVNCAAFPESLLESELFGYEDGAFSGARRGGKPGLFESAHNGTLFLDEVGDMPAALQIRLLRVLQERQVMPVGGSEAVPVNVRIIAATHRDLAAMVAAGDFRQDLFFRLNILRIDMPTLRERRQDIWPLAQLLYLRIQENLGLHPLRPLSPAAQAALMAYAWPGNIRELENVLERLAVYLVEMPADLTDEQMRRVVGDVAPELAGGAPADVEAESLADTSRRHDAAHIRTVLARCGGNRQEACAILGISATTLWRRLRENR